MNIVSSVEDSAEGFEILREACCNSEYDTNEASDEDADSAEAMNPEQVMREVLFGDLYQRLRVV